MIFVRVHTTATLKKGKLRRIKCNNNTPSIYASHIPLLLSQELLGLISPWAPPTIMFSGKPPMEKKGQENIIIRHEYF